MILGIGTLLFHPLGVGAARSRIAHGIHSIRRVARTTVAVNEPVDVFLVGACDRVDKEAGGLTTRENGFNSHGEVKQRRQSELHGRQTSGSQQRIAGLEALAL